MSLIPLITAIFLLGLLLGLSYPMSFGVGFVSVVLLLVCHSVCIIERRSLGLHWVAAFVLGWWTPAEQRAPLDTKTACYRVVEGQVETPWERRETRHALRLALHRASGCLDGARINELEPAGGQAFVSLDGQTPPPLQRGDQVRLRALVKPIVPRRNPGSLSRRSDIPRFGVRLQSPLLIDVIAPAPFPYRRCFDDLRRRFSRAFDRTLPPRWAGMAKALSLGARHALEPEVEDRFRRTGVAHLLSVSGLHLGLSTLFVYTLLVVALKRTRLVERCDIRRMAAWATIPAAVGFALMTGLRPPVFRAMIMAIFALVGRGIGRPAGTLEAICLAAVFILVGKPSLITLPGFQLSFAAVFGFSVVFGLRRRRKSGELQLEEAPAKGAFHRYLEAAMLSSVIATCATAPFVLLHFGMLPVMGVVINLIAIPLVGFVILPLLLSALAGQLVSEPLFNLAARTAAVFMSLLDAMLHRFSTLPLVIEYPTPSTTAALSVWAIAVLLWCARLRGWAYILGGPSLIILVIGLMTTGAREEGEMVIRFLDVGQGDSAVITTPTGEHLLIDAGGKHRTGFDAGADIVVPALKALGIARLHTLVISHPDADHAGGAPAVISRIPVGQLWETGHGEALGITGGYDDALALARRKQIPIERTPALCGAHAIGGVTVTVLAPCDQANGYDPLQSTNNNSLVIEVAHHTHTALFLGDIHADIEEKLVRRSELRGADILKVPHHGSRSSTSKALLDATAPAIAVISAGPFNRFRMPHPTVTARLEKRRIRTLRTDIGGAVVVASDGFRILSRYFFSNQRKNRK